MRIPKSEWRLLSLTFMVYVLNESSTKIDGPVGARHGFWGTVSVL